MRNPRGKDQGPRKRNPAPEETYALAEQCTRQRDKGLLLHDIAEHEGKSHTYVGNLIRCYKDLHPSILSEWKNGNPLATMTRLNDIRGYLPARQLQYWELSRLEEARDQEGAQRLRQRIHEDIERDARRAYEARGV